MFIPLTLIIRSPNSIPSGSALPVALATIRYSSVSLLTAKCIGNFGGEGFLSADINSSILHIGFIGSAKFKPSVSSSPLALIPTTSPVFISIKGPPELPGLIAASVCTQSAPL